MTRTIHDDRQLDIFAFEQEAENLLALSVPAKPAGHAGSLDCDQAVRRALNTALTRAHREHGKNRVAVAAELSALVRRRISKSALDSYTRRGASQSFAC